MKLEKSLRQVIFIRLAVAFTIFLFFYIYPILGWVPFKGLLFYSIGSIVLILGLLKVFNLIRNKHKLEFKRLQARELFFNLKSMLLFIFLLILFLSPVYVGHITETISKNNVYNISELAKTIVGDTPISEEKAKKLYDWFLPKNGNMYNIYNRIDMIFELYPIHIYALPPFLCIRLIGNDNPNWIYTSRCGSCSEFSLFYRELGKNANLTVRSIHNIGEDHNWDEVFVNNSWMVIDPSWPLYNVTPSFYEKGRNLNVSHVYAEYSNGTREDVTYRYSELGNLTISILDTDGKILPDATIILLSDNYRPEVDMRLNCTSNDEGKCNFKIGGGHYTVIAFKENQSLYRKMKIEIQEIKQNNFEIRLNNDILWSYSFKLNKITFLSALMYIIYAIMIWLLLMIYFKIN